MEAAQIAEALEEAANAAKYLAGEAENASENQNAVTSREDAAVMERWAHLYRAVGE